MLTDPELVRKALRSWTTGVTVVTTCSNGQIHGMTVSSFTSVSLTPPLVLVSIEKITRTHKFIEITQLFGVTILDKVQKEISSRFSNPRTDSSYRFSGVKTHTLVSGVPFITGGLAFFDCKVVDAYEAGTHTIFIGEVVAVDSVENRNPLLYFNQDYRQLSMEQVK